MAFPPVKVNRLLRRRDLAVLILLIAPRSAISGFDYPRGEIRIALVKWQPGAVTRVASKEIPDRRCDER